MAVHREASIRDRELPVNLDSLCIAFPDKGEHFLAQLVEGGNAPVETLTNYRRELDFNHVEPASRLRRVDELELLSQCKGFIGR